MITDEQFNKLPKFVQHEITRLRANYQHINKKLNETLGVEESNTKISEYPNNRNLPNNCTIKFILDERNYVEANIVDGRLRVHASNRINILPSASNAICIEGESC